MHCWCHWTNLSYRGMAKWRHYLVSWSTTRFLVSSHPPPTILPPKPQIKLLTPSRIIEVNITLIAGCMPLIPMIFRHHKIFYSSPEKNFIHNIDKDAVPSKEFNIEITEKAPQISHFDFHFGYSRPGTRSDLNGGDDGTWLYDPNRLGWWFWAGLEGVDIFEYETWWKVIWDVWERPRVCWKEYYPL